MTKTKVDKTHLSIDKAEERGIVHRDYIAHCFRWTHVVKWLLQGKKYQGMNVLDVGCGKESPMARTMYSNKLTGANYLGVDPNKSFCNFNFGKMKVERLPSTYFPGSFDIKADGFDVTYNGFYVKNFDWRPDLITSFEVLEHVPPAMTRAMLIGMKEILAEGGTVFISTPCWDPRVGAAANHPNEITRDALGALIEDVGFKIVGNWGTFASIRDYEPHMTEGQREVFNHLRGYYDSNALSVLMAPMFPEYSRNNIWKLVHVEEFDDRMFPDLDDIPGQWTSSDDWMDLAGDDL